jgi:branched-chain amino acid transport system substrate-binding protein
MKSLGALMAVTVLAIGCSSGGASNTADLSHEIIIASDLPTSAAYGVGSLQAQQAIGLAIRQQGSVASFRLVYMPLDDSLAATANPVKGLQNVKLMLRNQQVLGMVGPFVSSVAFTEIKIANGSDLAMVSPSNTGACLTQQASYCGPSPGDLRPSGRINYFRIAATDPLQGRAMARYVTQKLQLTRVAVFNEWGIEGQLIMDEFEHELRLAQGHVVLRQDLPGDTRDFTSFLTQAKAMQTQAVYAVGDSGGGPICAVATQMKKILPGARFLVTDGIEGDGQCTRDAGGANLEDTVGTFSDVDPRNSTDQPIKTLVDRYVKAYPKPSDVSIYTFASYDCARILIDAIQRAIEANGGSRPTRMQVVVALAATKDFMGVTGTYSFDANGDALSPLMSIYQFHGGQWSAGEKIDVSARPA